MTKQLISLILFFVNFTITIAENHTNDSLILVYDQLLENYETQINKRQQRIDSLERISVKKNLSLIEQYNHNLQLYKEFRPYISDSAIYYQKKSISLAEKIGDKNLLSDSKLQLSFFLASIGLYKESVDILNEIQEADLTPSLLIDYYNGMRHTYGELSFYGKDADLSNRYRQVSNTYTDKLRNMLQKEDDNLLDIRESDYRNNRDFKMSLEINDLRLNSTTENSQKYALLAFLRSLTYKESGDIHSQQKWLLKSAIADLKLGITDNASSWELANIMFKMGDIIRAHRYINYSVNNSNIFNARLRFTQIAEVQSIINNAYMIDKAEQEKKLRTLLIFISILSFLLLASVVSILLQNRRISKANARTLKANDELNRLNWELNRINDEISNTNAELSESNQVKEEYIGHFLSLCSLYIDKMDAYRKTIRKKLLNGQQIEVIEEAKSSDFMDNELKDFYRNFDRSFLQLYPDFVHEFNNLLLDEEKILLKKDELLNTELRIFALIRLGIDNSAKIAELLHYSANTIYNYRAKIKNKARISRNDFETRVKKIGTFTK